MYGSYRRMWGAIFGLMLLCGFGVHVYATDCCLTEALLPKEKVYAVFTNMKLDYQMTKGEELGAIPKEQIDEKKTALAADFKYSLPSGKEPKGIHKLKKPLEVKKDGQRYRLPEGTAFEYDLPVNDYKVTIPKGTTLSAGKTTPYVLAEDITVAITPPGNYQAALKIAAQRIVERIPMTGGMGTTLQVSPMRAPTGGYITVDVSKTDFDDKTDFSKAQFRVCLRLQGEEPNNHPFIASDEVEVKKLEKRKATLRARIPEIKEMSGVHSAAPVDLLVVACGPDGKMADVVSKEFAVSSRPLAIVCWVLAFVLPWFFAALVAACRLESGKKKGEKKEEWKRLKFLERWGAQLNPIWFVSGKYGSASLSLAQILLWTILIFSASFYVWVASGKLLALTNDVLMLLGIAGTSSVIAKIAASAKDERGNEITETELKKRASPDEPKPQEPKWLDLFKTEGRPDLYKFQMALFTALAAFFVTGEIYGTLEFPLLPAGLLTLIGISNGVYLAAKGTSTTVFERLAGKERELQDAKEKWEKLSAKVTEAGQRQKEVNTAKENAQRKLNETENQLKQASNPSEIEALTKAVEQQRVALKEAEENYNKVSYEKRETEAAAKIAEDLKKKLEEDFKTMLAEATKKS